MFDDSTREACKKAILIFHLVFVLLDSKTSGGSLYSHLCGALQVSASGEERFGAAVSKIPLFTVCVCVSFVINIVQFREMRKCVPGQNFTDIHPPSACPAG